MNALLNYPAPPASVQQAMQHHDPLYVNEVALEAGIVFAEMRRQAADKDAERKSFQQELMYEAIQGGATKTAAEGIARADPRYVEFLKGLASAEAERDRYEVIWRVLHQRAALLAKSRLNAGAEG